MEIVCVILRGSIMVMFISCELTMRLYIVTQYIG